MDFRAFKYGVAGAALIALTAVCAPAMADQEFDVSSVTTPKGVYNFGTLNYYYAGIIQFGGTLEPQGTSQTINVLCDDPNNEVNVGGNINPPYQYFIGSASAYLFPLGSQITSEVEGLDAFGLALYQAGTATAQSEEIIQLAMWQLEGATFSLTSSEQTLVNNLLNGQGEAVNGSLVQNWVVAAGVDSLLGVSWFELEDPDGANVNTSGQIQGQLGAIIPPGGNVIPNIPEPGTLGLLGVGLLGLAGLRRRKSTKCDQA